MVNMMLLYLRIQELIYHKKELIGSVSQKKYVANVRVDDIPITRQY